MNDKFIVCNSNNNKIVIRRDMIAAIKTDVFFDEKWSGRQYWQARIILTSGLEIPLLDNFDDILKIWTNSKTDE
mgnify:CR=1 FL=1